MLIVIGIVISLWRNSVANAKSKDNLYYAIQDTLDKTRNNLKQEITKTILIQQENSKSFLALKTKDSTITTLQAEVKANKKQLSNPGSSITDIYTQTKGKFTGKTDSVIKTKDSIKVGNIVYIYPEYKSHIIKDKWISADITANKDSTTFSPIINNQYSVLLGGTTKSPIVQVTNMNPYTTTTGLRAYQVINNLREKPYGIGIQIGYGGSLSKGIINIGPYIGIGITKTLIRW